MTATPEEKAIMARQLALAEDPDRPLGDLSNVVRGQASQTQVRKMLAEHLGGEQALQAEVDRIMRGRPRKGTERGGKSPRVTGTISPALKERLDDIGAREGLSESEMIREGLELFAQAHAA